MFSILTKNNKNYKNLVKYTFPQINIDLYLSKKIHSQVLLENHYIE